MKHLISISLVFFATLGAAELANAPARYLGVALPSGSKSIGENRFQSSRSYEETKKHFQDHLKNSTSIKRMGEEINLPPARAILYTTFDKKLPFYGINIYLNVQTGVTEIFFLVNSTSEEKP